MWDVGKRPGGRVQESASVWQTRGRVPRWPVWRQAVSLQSGRHRKNRAPTLASGNRRHSSRFRLPGLGVAGGMVQPGPHVSWCDRDGALGLPYKGTSAPLTPSSPWPHPSGVPVCWLAEASAAQVSLRRWFWEQWHPDHRPRSDPVLTRCSSLRGPGSAGGRLPALDPKELGQAPPEGCRGPRAASLALGQSLPSWG